VKREGIMEGRPYWGVCMNLWHVSDMERSRFKINVGLHCINPIPLSKNLGLSIGKSLQKILKRKKVFGLQILASPGPHHLECNDTLYTT
jgi:hypothetical protein